MEPGYGQVALQGHCDVTGDIIKGPTLAPLQKQGGGIFFSAILMHSEAGTKVCKGRWCAADVAAEVPEKMGKSPCMENFSLERQEEKGKN